MKRIIRLLPLIILPLLVWAPMLNVPFLWDDEGIIVRNSFVHSLHSIRFLFGHAYFSVFGELSYRPLITLSHILDSVIWGDNPTAHHAVNLLLHLLTVLLVYTICAQLRIKKSVAYLAAVLFAVHPLHLETLAVVAYRDDILMALFFTAALSCYIRFRKSPSLFSGFAACGLLILSLASKETALLFVPLVILIDHAIPQTANRQGKLSLLVLLTGVSVAYLFIRFGYMSNPDAISDISTFTASVPVWLRPITILFLAVRMAVLPVPHILAYADVSTVYPLVIQGVIIGAIGLYLFHNHLYNSKIRCAASLALIPLVAVMHIYPLENFFAGRYMYLPCIGFSLLIALGIDRLFNNARYGAIGSALVVIFFACLSLTGYTHVRTPVAFAQKLIDDNPASYKAYNYLGTIELQNNSLSTAGAYFQQSVEINPQYFEAAYNLASIRVQTGQFDEAQPLIEHVINLNPNRADGYRLMGDMYFESDDIEHARKMYSQALDNNRFDLETRNNLGILLETTGNLDDATDMYLSILSINPNYALAWSNLGNVNIARKEYELAQKSYLNALKIDPANPLTWYNLGNAYFYQNKHDQAATSYTQAIKLDPWFPDPYYNLAAVYVGKKDMQRAATVLRTYLDLRPDDREAAQMLSIIQNKK